MKANEKLDFLMKLTNTSNSALGKQLSFDASYISRIRSGKRTMPRSESFTEPVALYFAEHIRNVYQKKLAADLLCPGMDWPEEPAAAQQILLGWLSAMADSAPIGSLLTNLSSAQSASMPSMPMPPEAEPEAAPQVQFFYGDSGKREAVARFLTELGRMEKPPQLLLYSNEEFGWMYEDPAFARRWAMLLFAYIKKGGRIKIAHTISRASGEMLVALQKWIPVYMTGAIEPYYYPKILDRVFRKTMFIAEGHSAIMASSVGEHTENALNCLIHDPKAVRALEQEYWDFFGFCKPLMQIFNLTGRDRFLEVVETFHNSCENTIVVRTTPSFYTMPASVADSMAQRQNNDWIVRRQKAAEAAFEEMMSGGRRLTEILHLPAEHQVLEGKLPFPMCDLEERPGLLYQPEEFRAHLRETVVRLRKHANYQVLLSGSIPENELIYVKEDLGVILVKSDTPTIAFAINEQRMVSAFWDYLSEQRERGERKEKTIAQLEAYLERLEGK